MKLRDPLKQVQDSMTSVVWQTWTPRFYHENTNVEITGGSSLSARYLVLGKIVFFSLFYTLPASGMGNGALHFTLPIDPADATGHALGTGREMTTGTSLIVRIDFESVKIGFVSLVASVNLIANSRQVNCSGRYRVS